MGKTIKQNAKEYDVTVGIQSADSFREHAHFFISKIPNDMNKAHIYAANDFGGLITSATNMAFAIELYLKILRALTGKNIPDSHHLWELFKKLPQEIKTHIQDNYNKQNPVDGNDVAALEVMIAPSNQSPPNRTEPRKEPSLKNILITSSNTFQTWRYMYEIMEHKVHKPICYEYMRLDLIAHLVRSTCIQLSNKTQ
ncbi:MAG: hypothetical protein OEX12_13770 [Gammaproteobacteria bacterium]|nr:hypothetical protein [Gammaproteobacteria bacterium]